MREGQQIGEFTIDAVLSESLVRVIGPTTEGVLRLGPVDRLERIQEVFLMMTDEEDIGVVRDGEQSGVVVADLGGPGLDALMDAFDEARTRSCFGELARRLHSLHALNRTLDGLDPAGVRLSPSLRIIPMLAPEPRWQAPEGGGTPAGDWYTYGHLLYRVLTQGADFENHGETNAPDPRDLRADAPDDLCALAMDLLLLNPEERCGAEDVFEVLSLALPSPTPTTYPWLLEALEVGGLVVRRDGVRPALATLKRGAALDLHRDAEAVNRLVRRAQALSTVQRSEAGTGLLSPEALSSSAMERAGRWLGLALKTSGVEVLSIDTPSSSQLKLLRALLRGELAPLVVLSGAIEPEFLAVCAAEGVPGAGGMKIAAMPFAVRIEEPAVEGLASLGITAAPGVWGRMIGWWERAWTPAMREPASKDNSVNREVFRLAVSLVWTDPGRMNTAGVQLQRRGMLSGDADGVASSRVLLNWFGGGPHHLETSTECGAAWRRLGRAISLRQEGRFGRVEQLLRGELPFAGAGETEAAVASCLLAEALIERGRLTMARRILGQMRVDARLAGEPLWDAAARALLVRTGLEVSLDEAVGDGLTAIWTLRAQSEQALRGGRPAIALEYAKMLRERFQRWPLSTSPERVEVDIWLWRVSSLVAHTPKEVPSGHPCSPAWTALFKAVRARHLHDTAVLQTSLKEAGNRFDGANRTLVALACRRMRGLFLGGLRGGTLVEQADRALLDGGVQSIPRMMRSALPEFALPLG